MGDDTYLPIRRRRLLSSIGTGGISTFLAGCPESNNTGDEPATTQVSTNTKEQTETPTTDEERQQVSKRHRLKSVRTTDSKFEVRVDGNWKPFLVRGVNLGMAKPGRFPGEAAITRAEYDRWLKQIARLNANAIRVYTIHPPAFYEALAAHNERADQPVYLFHGNWLPADRVAGQTTAYDDSVTEYMDEELQRVVDVVNGNATLAERPGHASGEYTTDVSGYTLGYIIGVEWDPYFVERTNDQHEAGGTTDTQYIHAKGEASAFDRWLTFRLDSLTTYISETYDHYRPVSFTNWPTTDHLSHPSEPFAEEDMVSVNPNTIVPADDFSPGMFATYHVYPYYPDFQNYSRDYTEYTDSDSEKNSYAGYLHDLVSSNDHPVLIGEFGVPSSRGIAHKHVHGMDQGDLTESQQGRYDAELFETLVSAGTAGGIVFVWQDEWFKRTWNTAEYTDPNRRPYWLSVQCPEERFGLLSFDPSGGITLSGKPEEWSETTTVATASGTPRVALEDDYDPGRSLREIRLTADEGFLYMRIRYEDIGEGVDWDRMRTLVLIETTPTRGNTTVPKNVALDSSNGIDFVVELAGPSQSRVSVASYSDLFYYQYGERGGGIESVPYASKRDNGVFHPIRLALNAPHRIPSQDRTIPFQYVESGDLRFGNADPSHPDYDSLTDLHVDPTANTIEIRLPWQLLNFRDPSTRTITGDIWKNGVGSSQQIEDIGIAAVTYKPTEDGNATELPGASNATDILPVSDDSNGELSEFSRFTWDTWHQPAYEERLKESYQILRKTYGRFE